MNKIYNRLKTCKVTNNLTNRQNHGNKSKTRIRKMAAIGLVFQCVDNAECAGKMRWLKLGDRRIARGPPLKSYENNNWLLVVMPSGLTMRCQSPCKVLFSQDFMVQVVHERILVVVADGQCRVGVKDDMVFLYLADFIQVDDKGAVDAHEHV